MTGPQPKYHCPPSFYARLATRAALQAGLDPVKVLAGCGGRAHTAVRWAVWRALARRGYSNNSIGKAAGFDHTSVRYAVRSDHEPRQGRPYAYQNGRNVRIAPMAEPRNV